MIKIGEFSKLSRTTVKTLRYYESEGLLLPTYVDKETGYRYYETSQLVDLSKIISLRQMGASIEEIKSCLKGGNLLKTLQLQKDKLESDLSEIKEKLQRINYLLREKEMEKEVFKKELPECYVYYKEGCLKNYSDATDFILS